MKTILRKTLSVLLVLSMLFSSIPFTAIAEVVDVESESVILVSQDETPSEIILPEPAEVAIEEPIEEPTEEPTAEPTEEPTVEPTEEPTAEPTEEPTAEPTEEPTAEPTEEPTAEPTVEPTVEPTEESIVDTTLEAPVLHLESDTIELGRSAGITWEPVDGATNYFVRAGYNSFASGVGVVDQYDPFLEEFSTTGNSAYPRALVRGEMYVEVYSYAEDSDGNTIFSEPSRLTVNVEGSCGGYWNDHRFLGAWFATTHVSADSDIGRSLASQFSLEVTPRYEKLNETHHRYLYDYFIEVCLNCGDLINTSHSEYTEQHAFIDGVCICGATETIEPTAEPIVDTSLEVPVLNKTSETINWGEFAYTSWGPVDGATDYYIRAGVSSFSSGLGVLDYYDPFYEGFNSGDNSVGIRGMAKGKMYVDVYAYAEDHNGNAVFSEPSRFSVNVTGNCSAQNNHSYSGLTAIEFVSPNSNIGQAVASQYTAYEVTPRYEQLSSTQHKYLYDFNLEVCLNCAELISIQYSESEEPHSFVDGVCICGATDGTEPTASVEPTATVDPTEPYIYVDAGYDQGLIAGYAGGIGMAINIYSNVDWQINVIEGADWIFPSCQSGTGNGTFYTIIGENANNSERVGWIEITASGCDPLRIKVTQDAPDNMLESTPSADTPYLRVDSNYAEGINVAYTGAIGLGINIESNVEWHVNIIEGENWIFPSCESGIGDGILYPIIAENTSFFDRLGCIEITAPGCDPVYVNVIQAARVASDNNDPALKWDAHMKNGSVSTIMLDRIQGNLNLAYTYRVRVYDGNKPIREVELKSSYHSYNDLKLSRAKTYRFEVLECNPNGITVGYDAGNVTIPLYMAVTDVTTDISSIKFSWDGSYGVDKTLVYVTVDGHKVFSEVYGDDNNEDGDGPGTVSINGNKYAEYVRNGKNATVKIYVQPGRTKFDKSLGATWTGSVSGQKYDIYYKFHVDDDKQKSDGVITVPSGKTNMHVYFGNDPDNLMHPSVNKEYTYEVSGGDTRVLSVTPNGFNIGIVKQGCTTLLIKKDGVTVARTEVAVNDDYIYGFQIGYEKGSDLYYKGTVYTTEARAAFKNPQMTSEMKQLWFELNLGLYEVPTFEFESYNDDWLYHQGMKQVRYLHNFLGDVTGEIWDLCVDSIIFAGEGYDWIMTSTEMNNHDGLARSDKYAMAQVIVDGWLAEIEGGTLEVPDPELLEVLNDCELALIRNDPDSVDVIIKVLSDLLSVLGANPSNDDDVLIELLNEIMDGVGDGVSISLPAIDANKDELIFQIEKYKVEIIKDFLKEKAINEGLDKDIKIAVDDLIANSTNIWLRSALNFVNDAGDTISGMLIGDCLTTATCGLSVALQVSYNGLMDTTMELATGKTSDKWREYLTETDNYTGTLEGALKVYLKRTKPQLIEALNVYQNNPTLSNYYHLNNSNYSGKLQMWGMQSKQLSRLFYTIHNLNAGDDNAYAGNLQRDERTIFTFLVRVTHGLWGL